MAEHYQSKEGIRSMSRNDLLSFFAQMLAETIDPESELCDHVSTALSSVQGRRVWGREQSFFEALEELRGKDSDEYRHIHRHYKALQELLKKYGNKHSSLLTDPSTASDGQKLSAVFGLTLAQRYQNNS